MTKIKLFVASLLIFHYSNAISQTIAPEFFPLVKGIKQEFIIQDKCGNKVLNRKQQTFEILNVITNGKQKLAFVKNFPMNGDDLLQDNFKAVLKKENQYFLFDCPTLNDFDKLKNKFQKNISLISKEPTDNYPVLSLPLTVGKYWSSSGGYMRTSVEKITTPVELGLELCNLQPYDQVYVVSNGGKMMTIEYYFVKGKGLIGFKSSQVNPDCGDNDEIILSTYKCR